MRAEPTIEHLAFAEALAAAPDETSPEWARVCAGWTALRVAESWRTASREERGTALPAQIASARAFVEALDARDAIRHVLASLLSAIEESAPGNAATVRPRLMAFGRLLELDGRWTLAIDVYGAVLRQCGPGGAGIVRPGDAGDAAAASVRLGECHRHRTQWALAAKAFRAAMAHAAAAGDAGAVLRTRVLAAACEAERGALREADRTLKTIVAEAQSGGFAEATGLALHGRAHVAFQRGRFGAAVRHAYAALRYLNDPMARDRALGDIAAGFAELGVRSAARDAHMIVAATTQEPFVRWTALINLMELAALDRMEPVFEQYRRELAGAELPPRLAAYFHLYAGAGTWAFHRIERARSEYARAFAVANEAGLAQVAEQASDALARLDREGRTPEAKAAQPPPRGTTRVAAALAKMSAETVPRGRGGGWT